MNRKVIGLNVGRTLKSIFSFKLKKYYLAALLSLFVGYGFASTPSDNADKVKRGVDYAKHLNKINSENRNLIKLENDQDVSVALEKSLFENEEGKGEFAHIASQEFGKEGNFTDTQLTTLIKTKGEVGRLTREALLTQAMVNGIAANDKDKSHILAVESNRLVLEEGTNGKTKAEWQEVFNANKENAKHKDLLNALCEDPEAMEAFAKANPETFKALKILQTKLNIKNAKKSLDKVAPVAYDKLSKEHQSIADVLINNTATEEDNLFLKELKENIGALDKDDYKQALDDFAGVAQDKARLFTELRNHTVLANSILDAVNKGGTQLAIMGNGYMGHVGKKAGLAGASVKTGGPTLLLMGGNEIVSLGMQGSYLRTHMNFDDEKGETILNAIHFGPVFHYGNEQWFLNALVDVSHGSHDIVRNVKINKNGNDKFAIDETLTGEQTSWNFLVGFATGAKFYLSQSSDLALVPTLKLNYFQSFAKEFTEESEKNTAMAKGLSRKVAYKRSAYLNPRFELKLIKDFVLDGWTFSPAAKIGYLSYIPLTKGTHGVEYYNWKQPEGKWFSNSFNQIKACNKLMHQLILGLEATIATKGNFGTTLSYEANIGSGSPLHTALVNFNWKF